MPAYELAQLNVGTIKYPLDDPQMADFVANLDRINQLAENSPGFIWRLQTEEGDATALHPFVNEHTLVNMSVWRDLASLNEYVYRSEHVTMMRRRREWFERTEDVFLVLWWVPAGWRPTVEEALQRLDELRKNGPTPGAFSFRHAFPMPVPNET
ncbi:MAG: DUF3291 domain-containing protein [Burkholderiales bacterium]|nr:DUF3291 domain-containing protein [Burkholderiales bacterium]